jgi:O-antigen/teichoic acid export membrane protein
MYKKMINKSLIVQNRKQIITAGFWVVGMFGLSQLLRLGSNLVVTRLLTPEMFGLMAIVYVVLHGVNMFSDLGFWAFIVRHKKGAEKRILDTVWTMQVVRGWFMFIIIILLAATLVFTTNFLGINLGRVYGDYNLPLLLVIVGFIAVISGYNTLASALVSRDLKRARLELIEFSSQLLGAIVMLVWAWKAPSVWALASAGVVAAIFNVMLTYKLFSYRHNIAWDPVVVKEVFTFGKWIFIASALTYLAMQGDRLIFASYISIAQLGVYSIAFMLVGVVANVIQQLNTKVCFPIFSRLVILTPGKLKTKYYSIRLRQDIVSFFLIGVLISISPRLIEFLYDDRFYDAGWMMQILSFSLIGVVMSALGLECLSALSITKIRMKVMYYKALSVFIGLPVLFYFYGFVGALWGVVLSSFVGIPVQYLEMKRQGLFSFLLEIRGLPLVVIGYWSGNLMLYKIGITF